MPGNRLRCAFCLVVIASAVLLAGCEQPGGDIEAVDVRTAVYPVDRGTILVIESDRGTVEIRGETDRAEIEVTATIRTRGTSLEQARERLDELDLAETRTDDALYLGFDVPKEGTAWRASADVIILVPIQVSLDVIGDDVDVTVDNVTGTIRIDSERGRVEGRRLAGAIHIVKATPQSE